MIQRTRNRRLAVKVRLSKGAILPAYQTSGASGMDISAIERVSIPAGSYRPVQTGVFLELPRGMEVQVRPRSGLAFKHGIGILNSPGTIDSDYRGEIMIVLFNFSRKRFTVNPGDRIAQLVFSRVARAELIPCRSLKATRRGHGGFGHTGVRGQFGEVHANRHRAKWSSARRGRESTLGSRLSGSH